MNPFITTGYAGPEYFCDRIGGDQGACGNDGADGKVYP